VRVTLKQFLEERDAKRREAFSRDEDSGLLFGFLKCVFGWTVLNCCWWGFARLVLSSKLKAEMSVTEADRLVKRTLEVYSMVWMAVLVLSYTLLQCAIRFGHVFAVRAVGVTAMIIAGYRLFEIPSFLLVLHARDEYVTTARMRAVVRTIWHYLECVVSFGTFYVMASWWGDAFSPQNTSGFLES
jgi:hypothetical protein